MLNANYLLAKLREEGVAEYLPEAYDRVCMHEFVLVGRADEAGAGDQDARSRQAPARPRRPPADRVLPADRRGGAAGRADRDRDQGDARPFRRDRRRDPARGAARIPRSPAARRTRRRCAGSTRQARPAIRSSGKRCNPARGSALDEQIRRHAEQTAAHAIRELEALVAVSSPSGDNAGRRGGARAVRRAAADQARSSASRARPPGCAPDLIASDAGNRRGAG